MDPPEKKKPLYELGRSWWPVAVLMAVVMFAYRGTWTLTFASEDFLILKNLHRRELFEIFLEEWRGPWLGLPFVNFYRPVSTILLALELQVWGLDSTAFRLGRLVLHGTNSSLVWLIARRLLSPEAGSARWIALASGTLFALSPLHPSAVAFVGSYATLWGSFFSLTTLASFLHYRQTGGRWSQAVALVSAVLALGSYEAAVVLPLVLAVAVFMDGAELKGWKGEAWSLLPFATLSLGYLGLRRAVLGVFIGGYGEFQDRLLSRTVERFGELLRSLPTLVVPRFQPPFPREMALGLGLGLAAGILLFYLLHRRSGPYPTVAAGALVWVGILQAPFSFVGVVPATGRFWYLANFAGLLAVLCLVWGLVVRGSPRRRRWGRLLWSVVVLAGLIFSFRTLRRELQFTIDADRTVRAVQQALSQRPEAVSGGVLLVSGVPDFTRGQRGLPMAKVFQYGLHEAASPPFGGTRELVYSVPREAHPARIDAAARALGGKALRWSDEERRLSPLTNESASPETPERIHLEDIPGEGEEIQFRCPGCSRIRLFLLAPGASHLSPWKTVDGSSGEIPWPRDFLRSMAALYDEPVAGWLEDQDPNGRLRAASEVFLLPLGNYRTGARHRPVQGQVEAPS